MIRRELGVFLIVGALTVLVDFAIYRGLVWSVLLETNVAKATGFLGGTLFAYFANRFWTFGQKPHQAGSAWRFAVLYASTLATNVLINALILKLLINISTAVQLAFLFATAVSATLNFLGMKFFVFRFKTATELQ